MDLVVECYSSDREAERMSDYHDELHRHLSCPEVVQVSHHLAHVYSAFFPSPFDAAAVMVVDAQGSRGRDFTERYHAAPDLLEVASFYRCTRDGAVECLGKQLWDGDWNRPAGLGCFYYLLTRMIFPEGEGAEGKVMGLAPFGTVGAMGLPPLAVDGDQVRIPDEWRKVFKERDRFRYTDRGTQFRRSADLAAEGQHTFEEAILSLGAWLRDRTGAADLCFAGGTALNCSANGRLLRESGFDDLFIPPSPHDGGTALGCALYGQLAVRHGHSGFRWAHDFLGPLPDPELAEAAVHNLPPGVRAEVPQDLVTRVAELVEGGSVVGLYDGRSESGPRALGHRTILADSAGRACRTSSTPG